MKSPHSSDTETSPELTSPSVTPPETPRAKKKPKPLWCCFLAAGNEPEEKVVAGNSKIVKGVGK